MRRRIITVVVELSEVRPKVRFLRPGRVFRDRRRVLHRKRKHKGKED